MILRMYERVLRTNISVCPALSVGKTQCCKHATPNPDGVTGIEPFRIALIQCLQAAPEAGRMTQDECVLSRIPFHNSVCENLRQMLSEVGTATASIGCLQRAQSIRLTPVVRRRRGNGGKFDSRQKGLRTRPHCGINLGDRTST